MTVSLIQLNFATHKAGNIASAIKLIEEAVGGDRPNWICLPDCFDFVGGGRNERQAAAETFPDGPAYSAMQLLAKRYGIYIYAGSIHEHIRGRGAHPQHGSCIRPRRIRNRTVSFVRGGRIRQEREAGNSMCLT